jgi:glycosyltransferase involved in cell wall biosynthesis
VRVLLVNDHPPGPTGGAEVHVGRVADALVDAGCSVRVLVPDVPHRGVRRALDLWDPGARRGVRGAIAAFRPDVVHLHNVLDELSTSVAGLGVPTVLTVHDHRLLGTRVGMDQGRSLWSPGVAARAAKNRFARWRLRREVNATIAPSRTLADDLRRAGYPAVHHVENFAPATPIAALGPDIVFVGGLHPHKGPQVLLDAWAQVARRHDGVRLRIVGDGPLRTTLAASAAAAGIEDRVVLPGAVPPSAVAGELARACIVAVPSLGAEGGGPTLAVVEAMAAGRGVVVTDRPGVVEGVDDAVGVVVPAGDVVALAAALDELLSDPTRLENLGAAAAARAAERWSPEVACRSLLRVYREVCR